jgi:hypothetical protein
MRPIPIPAELVWPGAERKVIAPPDGDLANAEISPVETVVDLVRINDGVAQRFHILVQLDDGDLDRLVSFRDRFWLVFYGVIPVFDVGFPEVLEWFEVDKEGGHALGADAVEVAEPWMVGPYQARWPYRWSRNAAGHVIVHARRPDGLPTPPQRWYPDPRDADEIRAIIDSLMTEPETAQPKEERRDVTPRTATGQAGGQPAQEDPPGDQAGPSRPAR